MDKRPGKYERQASCVPFLKHIKDCQDKPPRNGKIVAVSLVHNLTSRPDHGNGLEMTGNIPIKVDIRKHGLPAAGRSELGKFIDKHLGKLPDLFVIHKIQIGGEGKVNCIPGDYPGKVSLERGAEPHHMGQKHFRVLSRFCHGKSVGKIQTKFLQIFK